MPFRVEGFPIAIGKMAKELRFFERLLPLGFALGLKFAKLFHVPADVAVDARFIEGQEQDFFRLAHKRHGFGERDVGLRSAGIDLIDGAALAENEEAVFDGLDAIETPVILRDQVGELHFEGTVGAEACDDRIAEGVVGGAVFIGHDGDLASESVTKPVETAALLARLESKVENPPLAN